MYEGARAKVAAFIGADKPKEVIFTRNATESINLVANTWGRAFLEKGDLVILTEMEHHSNLVPWQMLAEEKGLRLEFIPVTDGGDLDLAVFDQLLGQNPKLVAFVHMSNVLGTINPAKAMIAKAKRAGAITVVDAAQSAFRGVSKRPGCRFYGFLGSQDARSNWCWRTLWTGRIARQNAAIHGRRGYDSQGFSALLYAQRTSLEV
jgi:selenocysteine lyase/cysteine desulfurase